MVKDAAIPMAVTAAMIPKGTAHSARGVSRGCVAESSELPIVIEIIV